MSFIVMGLCLLPASLPAQEMGKPVPYGSNPEAGHYLQVGDAKLYYEIYGSGGVRLVLLHNSLYGSIGDFDGLIQETSKHRRVIAIATRGHGRSEVGTQPFSRALFANDAFAVIRHETSEKVDVVGFGDGAVTSYVLAATHPETVRRLVAISGPKGRSDFTEESVAEWKDFKPVDVEKSAPQFVAERKKQMPAPELWDDFVERLFKMWEDPVFVTAQQLRSIQAPTLIITGDRDPENQADRFVETYHTLPNGELGLIPGCRHVLSYCNPRMTIEMIVEFLDKAEPPSSAASGVEPLQIAMTASRWTTTGGAAFVQHRGLESIELKNGGEAVLKDLVFANGTIEFDVDSTDPLGAGIGFRRRDKDSFENFYLRTYPECVKNGDCLQYAPQTHGVLLWDLFPQYQAPAAFKTDDWNHIKLVISGSRMNVFLNGSQTPSMRIGRLEGDALEGGILLQGPGYFANLSVIEGAVEGLSPEPEPDATASDSRYLRNWTLSPYSTLAASKEVDVADLPAPTAAWQPLAAERAGLVNISRVYGYPIPPFQHDRSLVWLKTTIVSSKSQTKKVDFGWTREAWIFVNGKLVYADKNLYWEKTKSKPPDGRCSLENGSFSLPLKAGDNEVVVAVANNFYGWAFIFRLGDVNGIRKNEQERK